MASKYPKKVAAPFLLVFLCLCFCCVAFSSSVIDDLSKNPPYLSHYFSFRETLSTITLTGPSLSPRQYEMISIPLQVDDADPLQVFGDDFGGSYNPRIWRLFWTEPSTGISKEYPFIPDISPGKAYWIISRDGVSINATGNLVTDETYSVSIAPGWVQVGNPFNEEVYKDSLQVNFIDQNENNRTVYLDDPDSPIENVLWDFVDGSYVEADSMIPWKGYYVHNTSATQVSLLIPNPSAGITTGTLSLTVVDALSGEPINGARVEIDSIIGNTDQEGMLILSELPTGIYTLTVTMEGYITNQQQTTIIEGENFKIVALSPRQAEGSFRIVLTWGASPDDLDSHLTGPDGLGGRFHVYWLDQNPSGAGANLDVDDITSYGPETITITELNIGTYKYYVHDYTNSDIPSSRALAASGAKVEVYRQNALVRTFTVPSGAGTIWHVFDIDGATAEITSVNAISSGEVPLNSRGAQGLAVDLAPQGITIEDIFRNLPPKPYEETNDLLRRLQAEDDVLPAPPLPPTVSGIGTIAGTVINARTGIEITGARVSTDTGGIALSWDGHFLIVNTAGITTVTASKEGYQPSSVSNVAVTAGDETTVDISLLFTASFNVYSISTNLVAPPVVGQNTQITLTATTPSDLYYRWYSRSDFGTPNQGSWQMLMGWTMGNNTLLWSPASENRHVVVAHLTNSTDITDFHQAGLIFETQGTSVNPIQITAMTTDMSYPQPTGAPITLNTNATGGSGQLYYKYFSRHEGGNWVTLGNWNTNSNTTWIPIEDGFYILVVHVSDDNTVASNPLNQAGMTCMIGE